MVVVMSECDVVVLFVEFFGGEEVFVEFVHAEFFDFLYGCVCCEDVVVCVGVWGDFGEVFLVGLFCCAVGECVYGDCVFFDGEGFGFVFVVVDGVYVVDVVQYGEDVSGFLESGCFVVS